MHSITHAIPLTAQTDPNKFQRAEYQPYPRMMVRASDDPKLDGKPFYDVTGRIPVIVQNEEEEADFRAAHPGEVRDAVQSGASMQDELAKLREENARLKAGQTGEAPKSEQPKTNIASLVKSQEDPEDSQPAKPAAAAPRRSPPRKLD